jgi:hypothetical protein
MSRTGFLNPTMRIPGIEVEYIAFGSVENELDGTGSEVDW